MLASAVDNLRNAIEHLADVDVVALGDDELHETVVELSRLTSRTEAQLCRLLAEWDNRRLWASNGSKAAGARLARETRMPQPRAKRLVSRARALKSMPRTAASYQAGEIVGEHVDLIATCNRQWANAEFSEHEELLVNNCRTPMFEHAVKATEYWKQFADADVADQDAKDECDLRNLSASTAWRGLVELNGTLDPVGGEIFLNELNRLCELLRQQDLRDGVERTPTQRRADALVEMASRSATAPADGIRPRPLITITLGIEPFNRLCETAAGTVVAPGMLLPLLSDADIERIVYDPPNRKLEASHRRRFVGAVRRVIEVRDRHCQHESGCSEPVSRCDVDHVVDHADSEFTCLCNGQLLCTTHNRIIKNAERWKRRQRSGQPLPISFDQIPKWNIRRIDLTTLIAQRAPPTAN